MTGLRRAAARTMMRCAVHGFLLDPKGQCLRCEKEGLRTSLRKLYVASAILVGVLVLFAGLRGVATAFPSRPAPVSEDGSLVVYTTTYCPACRTAKRWMTDQGITYVEKNVDDDRSARQEWASTGTGVVPTFVVSGEVLKGFNPRTLEGAMARHHLR